MKLQNVAHGKDRTCYHAWSIFHVCDYHTIAINRNNNIHLLKKIQKVHLLIRVYSIYNHWGL